MRTGLRRSAFVAVLAAACGGGESTTGPTPPPSGPVVATVEVSPASGTVRVGATVQLTAVAKDAQGNALTGKVATWTTSSGTVATVSTTGLVTGVARGTVTVTAAGDGKSGSASVVVEDETSLLPVPGCRDCLEIAPGGLLLTGAGEEAQLAAYLVDGAGVRTKVAATYTSAKPAVVTVSAAGVARAVAFGSAQVTAQANGKTSAPIVVLVASPAAGAVLVADTLIDGRPTPSDPQAPYGVGYKYKVRLRGLVPTVGQLLVGSGSLPVLGRVVGVTPVSGGLLEAELEVRPMAESFREFAINEKMRLVDVGVPATPVPTFWPTLRLAQRADDPLEKNQFRLGSFVCESNIGASVGFPVNVLVEALDLNPQLDMELVATASGGHLLAVTGTLAPQLTVTPTLTASLDMELECRKTIRTLQLPARLAGALSVLITPQVPVGVGFTMAIKSGIPDLSVKATVQGSVFVGVALNCNNFQCATASQTSGSLTSTFTPSLPTLGARHEMEVGGFVFAELELSNPIVEGLEQGLGEDFDLTFFDFVTGMKQALTFATMANQADDPAYASGASFSAFWEANSEAELEFGDLLSVQLLDYSEEGDTALAETPKGDLFISEATVRAGVGDAAGPTVLLRATIFPVTYLGSPSVEGVEFFRKPASGPLESVCGFIQPDHPGQVEFECERGFTEDEIGTHEIYAFVTTKLFGRVLSSPFEIAPDSKATIEVLPPCLVPSGPSPSPSLADDSCGRVIEGDVIVRNDGELAALADVGEITGDLWIEPAVTSTDLRELGALYRVGAQLRVRGTQTTLSGLRSLGEVGRQVTIETNTIRDLRGLERLTSLSVLYIKSTTLTDLSGLRDLRAVGRLTLEDLPVASLTALANVEIGLLPVVSGPGLWIDDLNNLTSLAGLKPLAADFPGSVWITGNNVLADLAVLRNTTRIRRDLVVLLNGTLQNLSHLSALERVDERLSLQGTSITSLDALSGLTRVGVLVFYPEYRPFVYRLPALTRAGIKSGDRLATCSHSTMVQYEFPLLAEGNFEFAGTVFPATATQCRYDFRAPAFQRGRVIGAAGSGLRDLTLGSLGPEAGSGASSNVDLRGLPHLRTITAPNVDIGGNLILHDNPALTSVSGISGRVRGRLEVLRNTNLDQCAALTWANGLTVDGGRFVSGNRAC